MLKQPPAEFRNLPIQRHQADLAVVGGGLAGLCAAITAARAGARVVLVHDRPVLGGNASSEVRMVVLGATASGGNNNRWAREGGLIDEFLLENVYRNPRGNPVISDALLLEMADREPNLTLLLDTAVWEVVKTSPERIELVRAFCPADQTIYEISAPLFCDASGDGIVGFLTGAAFRMGAEARDEFDEPLAPDEAYGHLLGHTIYFTTKDVGRPVAFVRPSFAIDDVTKIARWERIRSTDQGRDYWWLEYGGRLDTIHDTRAIKWELWRIVYSIWDHIKNSGQFPEAETLALEWVGTVPGKRESRRFEGDTMLSQRDVVEGRRHDDAVSYGGWSMDLHPADGVYSELPPCNQWHAKAVYQIPYRALYSRNIANLFLAGRIISATHVAFGSTRVMATCAQSAQAVGMAAALCCRENLLPADLAASDRIGRLQLELARTGQFIPGYVLNDPDDLAHRAAITASSRLSLTELPADGQMHRLDFPRAVLLPVSPGRVPRMAIHLDAERDTQLAATLRTANRPDVYTPEQTLAVQAIDVPSGANQTVWIDFGVDVDEARYVFLCLAANEHLSVRGSRRLVTGLTTLANRGRTEVTAGAVQSPPAELGVDAFEFWRPLAGEDAENLAVRFDPSLDVFPPEVVVNGQSRPTAGPNAWVANPDDPRPTITLRWPQPQSIGRIELTFDTDRDNPLFSVQYEHPRRVMPQCIRAYRLLDAQANELACCEENHQTRNTVLLNPPVLTEAIQIELVAPSAQVAAALHEVRCYVM